MKIYNYLIGAGIILTIMIISIPQFTGTVFVNNREDRIPTDWLSKILLKAQKPFKTPENYKIPKNIKAIRIIGSQKKGYEYSNIEFKKNNGPQDISSFYLNEFTFSINKDTLLIKANDTKYNHSLNVNIDSDVKNVIIDNYGFAEVVIDQYINFDMTIENRSEILLSGQENMLIKNIEIKGESTLTLSHCSIPLMNLKVVNSMVYVDPLNHIDSLKANLIGKSNIKKQKTVSVYVTNSNNNSKQALSTELAQVNIYPEGNLKYYTITP